ncbi:MAG: hypothetical protein ACTTHG_06030 [Treponemataceae bacterium]
MKTKKMKTKNKIKKIKKFETVDIEEFYDSKGENPFSTDIILLTPTETELIKYCSHALKKTAPEVVQNIEHHVEIGRELAKDISHFPSLLRRWTFNDEVQTQHTLAESLLEHRDGDKMLHLPTKATLGKGFLVAKFHSFAALTRVAKMHGFPPEVSNKINNNCLNILFTLMAEDVYLSLLDDTSLSIDIRREIAYSLLILWEHRTDQKVEDIAPVLNAVWKARRKIAPAFGTMVGTSELLLLSIEMDEQWRRFISSRLGDSDVSAAMEEYLFGISYEKIQKIKKILKEKGITAVNRDEVANLLGEKIPSCNDEDYRTFYQLYSIRRDDAAVRKRMNLPGPHQTLEAHYTKFIMECNKERQENDPSAK